MTELLESIEFWHWWVLATVLIAIEVFAPTTLFLWMGISAGAVGLVVFAFRDIAWEFQVLLFAVLSVVNVVAWRFYRRLRPAHTEDPLLNRRAEQCVGRLVTLDEPIVNGEGKVKLDGILWKVGGEDFGVGTRVKVVGVDGVTLRVEEA